MQHSTYTGNYKNKKQRGSWRRWEEVNKAITFIETNKEDYIKFVKNDVAVSKCLWERDADIGYTSEKGLRSLARRTITRGWRS